MSNPTNPFSWQMPTPTDLVTDLPADFEVFGQAVATSLADLLGGTTGQVLAKNSNTDMDFVWSSPNPGDITAVTAGTGISGGGTSGDVTITNSMATAIDAKGDLIAGTGADAFSRLAVGTNGQVLTADSTAATGLAWTTVSAGSTGPAFRAFRDTTDQSISSTTVTKIQLNAETFDTNGCFDSTTNYRFTPTTAGYYLISGTAYLSGGSGYGAVYIHKNGSRTSANRVIGYNSTDKQMMTTDIIYFNGSTDYVELYCLNNGASGTVARGSDETYFTGSFIHA